MISNFEECAQLGRFRTAPAECGLCAGGLLLGALIGPPLTTAPLVILSCILLIRIAGVSWKSLLKSMVIPLFFLATGALSLSVSVSWNHGWSLHSDAALRTLALQTTLRSGAATLALLFLVYTVPVARMGDFLRWLRIPVEIVDLVFLMYRTIGVLGESLQVLQRAHANRMGNASLVSRLRGSGLLAARLFLLSQNQARKQELGLAARGYRGVLTVLPSPVALRSQSLGLAFSLPLTMTLLGFFLDYYVAANY